MRPNEIRPEHFNAYPPMAGQLLIAEIDLLRRLPLGFAPLLLRELIEYDWQFPVERRALDREIAFLKSLSAERFERLIEGFVQIRMSRDLENIDWVNEPANGRHYRKVNPGAGVRGLLQAVARRAESKPLLFGHWYIDGDTAEPVSSTGITTVSYRALAPVLGIIHQKMRSAYESRIGPEAMRTLLARLRTHEVGMPGDTAMSRFQTNLLTEGSGTRWFSTAFVQWAAREGLRRAQPVTLLARFTPRVRERPTGEILAASPDRLESDPQGSLVDADMGAYYTWLNQQRPSGADRASFLVWFEGHLEALARALTRAGDEWAAETELPDLVRGLL
jgi:hypothetical protein